MATAYKKRRVMAQAWDGMLNGYIETDPEDNEIYLTRTMGSTGLGNSPYRPGTFGYYVGEAIRSNDPHGAGPFILASVELGR